LIEWTKEGFPHVENSSVHDITGEVGNITIIVPGLMTGEEYYVRLAIDNGVGYGPYLLTSPTSATPAGDGTIASKAAASCKLIKDNFPGRSPTGVYWLNPMYVTPFKGYCDMDTTVGSDSSGWTLVTKLRDVDDTLNNHRSNKFSGTTWYSDNETSLTAVGGYTPAENKTLLPFSQDDTLWGSYDAGLFKKFKQIMVYYGKMEDRVDNEDYYVYDIDHDAWTNFPAKVTKKETCVEKRVANVVTACDAGEYLSYMGDNKKENYYLTSSCATDDFQAPRTKYQSICIRTKFTDVYFLGFNFVTMTEEGVTKETCKFFGSVCKNFHGRRFEVWIR